MFVLKVMDEFVANEMRMPATRRDDDAVGSDVVGSLACEAICLGALWCGTKDSSRDCPNAPNMLIDEGYGFIFQRSCFAEARQLIDTHALRAAVQAEQLGRNNAYRLESSPCCDRDEMYNESREDKVANEHEQVP